MPGTLWHLTLERIFPKDAPSTILPDMLQCQQSLLRYLASALACIYAVSFSVFADFRLYLASLMIWFFHHSSVALEEADFHKSFCGY